MPQVSFPPGPGSAPLLQTLHWIRRPEPFLDECREKYGAAFTLTFVGNRKFVILADPEDVRAVFAGSPDVFLSGRANQTFKPFLGEHSLFVLDGPSHKRHRRLLMPHFQGARMGAYGEIIRDVTLRHLESWPLARAFSLYDAMHDVTLEIIYHAIFGVADAERMGELTRLVRMATGRASALVSFISALQVDLGPWSPWGRFIRARDRLNAILDEEIARARRAPEGREDILARLASVKADAGESFSDAEIRDELKTLLGAGHETTTAGLAWAFQWALGLPDVKERLCREVRGAPGGAISIDRIRDLPYLDAVVNETLRLHPPISIVARYLASDAAIGGWQLPAGTIVCPCPHLAQRDARLFPDPLAFRPERRDGARHAPHELFPFGGGNRACIGLSFALSEMAIVMATVIAHADLRLDAPPSHRSVRRGIIVAPADGTLVRLERRLS